MSVKSNWFITSASFTAFLSIFSFHDLSIDERGMLKSPAIIVCVKIYALNFSRVSLMNVDALVFGVYVSRTESSC